MTNAMPVKNHRSAKDFACGLINAPRGAVAKMLSSVFALIVSQARNPQRVSDAAASINKQGLMAPEKPHDRSQRMSLCFRARYLPSASVSGRPPNLQGQLQIQ
jgi:hypothetical protein